MVEAARPHAATVERFCAGDGLLMTPLNPPERCDIVLEGGVTSAVIYAGLLATLGDRKSVV